MMKSKVQENAGLLAKFDDKFILPNIYNAIQNQSQLVIAAFDADVVGADPLGTAQPISYVSLVEDGKEKHHDIDLYLNCQKTGNL